MTGALRRRPGGKELGSEGTGGRTGRLGKRWGGRQRERPGAGKEWGRQEVQEESRAGGGGSLEAAQEKLRGGCGQGAPEAQDAKVEGERHVGGMEMMDAVNVPVRGLRARVDAEEASGNISQMLARRAGIFSHCPSWAHPKELHPCLKLTW